MKQLFTCLYVILLCAFNSCSSDDENNDSSNPKPIFPLKKLSKIEEVNDNKVLYTYNFIYDNGKWIKYIGNRNNEDILFFTLSYDSNTITLKDELRDENDKGNTSQIFTLNNKGQIISGVDPSGGSVSMGFGYENDYLTIFRANFINYEYSSDILTKAISKNFGEYIIKYTDIEDKIGFNVISVTGNGGRVSVSFNNPLYQLGYFGKRSKYLVQSIKAQYLDETLVYNYELDKEGYVTEVSISSSGTWGSGGVTSYKIYYE